jgi:hypothetical protein
MVQRRMKENDMALRVLIRKRVGHALNRLRCKDVACRAAGVWRATGVGDHEARRKPRGRMAERLNRLNC